MTTATAVGRIVQDNFSAGMFRSVAAERIPASGVWDIENGLLDEDGAVYRRGGTRYASPALTGDVLMVWDGYLASGRKTFVATTSEFGTLDDAGAYSSLGGAGLAAPAHPVVHASGLYLPGGVTYTGGSLGTAGQVGDFYASVANRLLVATGSRIDFSDIGSLTFDPTNFHEIPGGVTILGMEGLRDSAAVFTTQGVWIIGNLAYNLTDPDGNIQQRLDRYSADLVLWGAAGIAGWSGGLVVPALDGLWLLSLGVTSEAARPFQRLSGAIEDLYRDYVRAGFQPGQATVFRGHYLLPILSGSRVVDELVVRLDSQATPWSRFSGYGMAAAHTVTNESQRRLLAGVSGRVLDCRYFEPSAADASDADGSAFPFEVTLRDVATGQLVPNTITKLRARYELEDAAGTSTLIAELREGRGTTWGSFTWGDAEWTEAAGEFTALQSMRGGSAPEDPDALSSWSWRVRRQLRFARFRLRCVDTPARLVLRSLEVFVRGSSRI